MKITDIRIKKIDSASRMKAVVSVTFDGEFVVHDIKIIEGPDKLFLAMPSRRLADGRYSDIAHPISCGMRDLLEREIVSKYLEMPNEPSGFISPTNPEVSAHAPGQGEYAESEAW